MLLMRYREIPPFEKTEFFPKRTRYCFMPIVYNEGDRFKRQLERMSKKADLADIVVVEKRSSDGSTDHEWLKKNGTRALLTTDASGGATAVRLAIDFALQQGYEGLVLVDGHGKDGIEALPKYLTLLDQGADFIQGSRFLLGGKHENTPFMRWVGIRCILTPLFWLSCGFKYTDAANGFRGYSKKYLEDERVEPLRSCFVNYNLQFYLTYRAPKLQLKVVEIPVSRVYPSDAVPTKVVGFKRNFMVFWEMLQAVRGAYDVSGN